MTARPAPPRFDLERIRAVTGGGSKRFWSSLEELIDEEGFRDWLAGEFPAASSMFDDPGRRQFLKLMGASLLLGGLTACNERTRSDQALPYVNQPDQIVPGVARYYATAVLFEGYAQPVIATTYAGRPTKLDGNPDHPATGGSSDAFMQSAIFGLYDPERSKIPVRDGAPSTWGTFSNELLRLRAHWRERQGEGLRILTGATSSPTLIRQMQELAKQFPKMRWHRFEPVGTAAQDEAMALAFGRAATPHLRLDRCDVIVSIDHDLLGPGAASGRPCRGVGQAARRDRPGPGPRATARRGMRAEPHRHRGIDPPALRCLSAAAAGAGDRRAVRARGLRHAGASRAGTQMGRSRRRRASRPPGPFAAGDRAAARSAMAGAGAAHQ